MLAIKKNRNRTGATAVEYAFVAPVLFLLLFGLLECSRLVMVKQAATNAAREGCRKAILATTTSSNQVKNAVIAHMRSVVPQKMCEDNIRVTVEPSNFATVTNGTRITTKVSISFSDISWVPNFFPGSMEVNGTATMERD